MAEMKRSARSAGDSICEHGRQRQSKECEGSSYVSMAGRRVLQGIGGSSFNEHGRRN
jgi:hypothetical protein